MRYMDPVAISTVELALITAAENNFAAQLSDTSVWFFLPVKIF